MGLGENSYTLPHPKDCGKNGPGLFLLLLLLLFLVKLE